jgi:hypothetical protein
MEVKKQQISILRSGNNAAILDTVREVRTIGSSAILPEIFDLLLVSESEEVISACAGLLNDLKQMESVDYLISAIKSEKYKPVRNILVSACWQNGLDYHKDAQLFADIFLHDDYIVSIEAFTVIENSIGDMEDSDIRDLTAKLKLALASAGEKKKTLISELLSVIQNY